MSAVAPQSELEPQQRCVRTSVFWVVLFAVAAGVCWFSAYQRAFCTFAEYDDEGYVMLSLQQHLQGGVLYDDVFTQYGPAWYACQTIVHRVAQLPVTHDVTRFKTIMVWLLSAVLAALVVGRISGCRYTAFAAFALAFLHLDRLTLEPGHPQELCLLAVVGVLAMATSSGILARRGLWLLGLIVGAAVMTKLNVGLLLVASITLALALVCEHDRWRRAICLAAISLIVCGAVLVTRATVFEERGLRLPTLVVFSMLSVFWFAYRSNVPRVCQFRTQAEFHVAWLAAAAGFVLLAVSHGTTAGALLDGLVLQHLGFADRFYMSAPVFGFAGPLAVMAFGACVWFGQSERVLVLVRYVRLCILALLIGVVLKHFVDLGNPLQHGLDDRGQAGLLMSLVAPFAWLVLFRNPGETWSRTQWFGRVMLACVGGLQPLIAYPTPGTQMAVGSVPLLLIALLSVRDFLANEVATKPRSIVFAQKLRVAMVVCSGTLLCVSAYHANARMSRMTPLNLAGASRLSLPPRQVQELQELVAAIHASGETFVCLHNGYNSLYLLADVEPPTGLNATFWPWLLSDVQQNRVVDALREKRRVCCVEKVIGERNEPPATPLGEFLSHGFANQATIGLWRVMSNDGR